MVARYSQASEVGARKRNEDALLTWQDRKGNRAVFAVADGMGGYAHGEKASHTIVDTIETWLRTYGDDGSSLESFSGKIKDLLKEANRIIYETENGDTICGSTVVVLITGEDRYIWFSTGDSRIYLARGLHLRQLTRDDIWDNQEKVQQQFTPEEQRLHPNHGKLTHAVGIAPELHCNTGQGRLNRRDRFLVCTDGVYKHCSKRKLSIAMLRFLWKEPDVICRKLMNDVLWGGATDNATLIATKYL